MKKILIITIATPLLIYLGLKVSGYGFFINAIERTYLKGHATANINDSEAFSVRTIKAGEASPIVQAKNYNLPLTNELEAYLKKFDSVAFLIMQNGELLSEHYFNGYDERSRTNSFSMAKTVLTMMVGIAIEQGFIKSFEQAITDFIPEFKDDPLAANATLAHFSLMNSGYEWVEHYYSWFSPTVELYHGSDVETFVTGGEFSAAPGDFWEYSSASTQVLGVALKRALRAAGNTQTLSDYLSENIWQPLGMNDDGIWHLDDSDMELVFCCLNTNAKNYAKLGQLMLNNGVWNGEQIIPAAFVKKMIQPDGQPHYGYSTWLNYDNAPKFYFFSGHLGQSIIVVPDDNMVIVRLGERTNQESEFRTEEMPYYIDQALSILANSR